MLLPSHASLEFTEELSYDNPHGNVAIRLI